MNRAYINPDRCDPSRPDEAGEPAPHIELMPMWRFVLGKSDSLLVLKALGGRLTDDLERAQARALGNRLTELRAKASSQYDRSLQHADAKRLAEEGGGA